MMTIKEMQVAHAAWSSYNFGARPAHWPLLGIGEELGELFHAQLKMEQGIRGTKEEHHANQRDAVADVVIFASDYCSAMGWDLEKILSATTFVEFQTRQGASVPELLYLLNAGKFNGRLMEAFIVCDTDSGEHSLLSIFKSLASYCKVRDWDMQQIVEETWAKVSQRDWKKNAKTGGDLDAKKTVFTFTPEKEGLYVVRINVTTGEGTATYYKDALELPPVDLSALKRDKGAGYEDYPFDDPSYVDPKEESDAGT